MSATVITIGPTARTCTLSVLGLATASSAWECAAGTRTMLEIAAKSRSRRTLGRMRHSCVCRRLPVCLCHGACAEPVDQVVTDAQGIGNDRQRGIHRRAGRKEAAVDDVEIVHFVRLAIDVQRRSLRILAETNRAVLMGDARERDLLSE